LAEGSIDQGGEKVDAQGAKVFKVKVGDAIRAKSFGGFAILDGFVYLMVRERRGVEVGLTVAHTVDN